MKRFLLLSMILFIAIFYSCKKNNSATINTNPTNTKVPFSLQEVTSTIKGSVVDELGNLVANATVKIASYTSTTDASGMFSFENITTKQFATLVEVSKVDYVTAYKTILVTASNTLTIKMMLCKPSAIKTFMANNGIATSINNMELNIKPNTIVYENSNTTFNGTVTAQIFCPKIQDSFFIEKVAGGTYAIDRNNQLSLIQHYGSIGVQLTDSVGNKLQLQQNTTAIIRYTIPNNLPTTAPEVLQISHFDEAIGYWRQEGGAIKNGNVYETEVSHFSLWDFSFYYPFPAIFKLACVTEATTNNILYGYYVIPYPSTYLTYNGIFATYSNLSATYFCCLDNESGHIDVLDVCGNLIYTYNFDLSINPNSTQTTLSSTVLNSIEIKATIVDCNNNPLPDAEVYYTEGAIDDYFARKRFDVDANGQIQINMSLCYVGQSFKIIAYDIAKKVYNYYSFVVPNSSVNLGNLQACGRLTSYIGLNGIEEPFWKITSSLDANGETQIAATDWYLKQWHHVDMRWIGIGFNGNGTAGTHQLLWYGEGMRDPPSTMSDKIFGNYLDSSSTTYINIPHYSLSSGDSITGNFICNVKDNFTLSVTTESVSFRVSHY